MARRTVITIAKALIYQHGFDYDVAYLSAWYGTGRMDLPTASPYEILAWLEQVRRVPAVTEVEAEGMLRAYASVKRPSHVWPVEQPERVKEEG